MNDITALAKLRAELANPAIGSKDHLRKIALSLVEALEKAQKLATQQGNIACALFDEVTAQRQRIAELESRTVTVKWPSLKQTESGERYVWSDGVFNYRADVIEALRAAGIQVIEGDA